MCQDSNPAKTHSLPTEIIDLLSGPNEAQVPGVSLQTNSVKEKVIGKRWIYLERNTLHRVWATSGGNSSH